MPPQYGGSEEETPEKVSDRQVASVVPYHSSHIHGYYLLGIMCSIHMFNFMCVVFVCFYIKVERGVLGSAPTLTGSDLLLEADEPKKQQRQQQPAAERYRQVSIEVHHSDVLPAK